MSWVRHWRVIATVRSGTPYFRPARAAYLRHCRQVAYFAGNGLRALVELDASRWGADIGLSLDQTNYCLDSRAGVRE
jgi:hypothetical protein